MVKNSIKRESEPKGNYKFLIIVMSALILAFIISTFFYTNTRIDGNSMSPFLNDNDWVITDRLSYLHTDPEFGDIVVIKKKDVINRPIVKRIIGIPFDTVEIKDGQLYINSQLIKHDFCPIDKSENMKKITVPRNCYYLMGDNRKISNDSRKWADPFVKRKELIGKVIYEYYPNVKKFK